MDDNWGYLHFTKPPNMGLAESVGYSPCSDPSGDAVDAVETLWSNTMGQMSSIDLNLPSGYLTVRHGIDGPFIDG